MNDPKQLSAGQLTDSAPHECDCPSASVGSIAGLLLIAFVAFLIFR